MEKLTCSKCTETKELGDFYRETGKRPLCKNCFSKAQVGYNRRHREKNPEAKAKARAYMREYRKGYHKGLRRKGPGGPSRFELVKIRRREIAEYIRQARTGPCTDCLKVFPTVCMDFDHLPQFEKRMNISDMVATNQTIESVKREIAKCELVCACCHRIRTHSRANP